MKARTVQSSFLSGVIDPRGSARIETDAYNEGLLIGNNIELNHLGGVRRRRGLRFCTHLSNVLTRVTALTPTAPNGGTAANANDDDEATSLTTTTPVGTTNEFVVVQYDCGTPQTLVLADVMGISTASGSSVEFRIQGSDDGLLWDNVNGISGAAANLDIVDTTPRDYRRSAVIARRYWRIARIGTTNLPANITIQGFNLWLDSGTISNVKLVPFEVGVDERYVLAFTDRAVTILENGVLVGYIPSPYESADILTLDADASEGELVVVHYDYAPRVFYEDTTENFQSEPISFASLPQVDFNDGDSPTPVSEVQEITFGASYARGNTFQIELNGARTGTITFAGDSTADERNATAANIARGIQKLYTVRGFSGVSCARTDTLEYTVTFAGSSADAYQLMSVATLTGTDVAIVVKSATGTPRTEDVWSDTRGWPGTVAFFAGRIYFGGSRSKLASLFGSAVIDTASFEGLEALDDDPIFVTLSGQQTNTIVGLASGRVFQVFTTGGEFRYVKPQGENVKPSDKPFSQTQYGAAKIRPVSLDGVTVYAQATRKSVRDFKYSLDEDAFTSLSLSSLAQPLLNDIVDIASWNGSREDELSYLFVVNGDGTVAVLNLRREADVRAWFSWTTLGEFKAVACPRQQIFFAVLRELDGVDTLTLEEADPDYYLDCAVKSPNSPAQSTIVGLGYLDGVECRVRADGYALANVTPENGQAEMAEGDFADVEVGLDMVPTLRPMPLNGLVPTGSTFMTKRRVRKVRVKVRNTLGLRCNGRILPDRKLDVDNFDAPAVPRTTVHALEESTNWDETEEKIVTFDQVDPMPLEILAIQVDMEAEV